MNMPMLVGWLNWLNILARDFKVIKKGH